MQSACLLDGKKGYFWYCVGQRGPYTKVQGTKLMGPPNVGGITTVELYVVKVKPGSAKPSRNFAMGDIVGCSLFPVWTALYNPDVPISCSNKKCPFIWESGAFGQENITLYKRQLIPHGQVEHNCLVLASWNNLGLIQIYII